MPENPLVRASGQSGGDDAQSLLCQFRLCGEPIDFTPTPGGGRPPSYHSDKVWEPDGRTCAQLAKLESAAAPLRRAYEAAGLIGAPRLDLTEFAHALRTFDDHGLDPLREFAEAVHALDGRVGQAHALLRQDVTEARAAEEHALADAAEQRRLRRLADVDREQAISDRTAAQDDAAEQRRLRGVADQARDAAVEQARLAISARDVLAAERDAANTRANDEKTARERADTAAAQARSDLIERTAELTAATSRVSDLTSELNAVRDAREDDGRRHVTEINDLHATAQAARDELRTQLTAEHQQRWDTRETEHREQIAELERHQAEALETQRTELTAETERQLAAAALLHEQERAALAAQVEDLGGRVTRAETAAARTRGDRDRYAGELQTLRENLYLELAHGPDAAPLAGRIAAALGAGAARMAREPGDAPAPGADETGGEDR